MLSGRRSSWSRVCARNVEWSLVRCLHNGIYMVAIYATVLVVVGIEQRSWYMHVAAMKCIPAFSGYWLYIYSTSSILTANSQLLLSSLLMEVLLTGNVQCSQHGDSLDTVIILVLYCNLTWSALHLKACSSIGQIHQHSNVRWPRRVRPRSRVAAVAAVAWPFSISATVPVLAGNFRWVQIFRGQTCFRGRKNKNREKWEKMVTSFCASMRTMLVNEMVFYSLSAI